jgi:parallel beta-helix repeat protein
MTFTRRPPTSFRPALHLFAAIAGALAVPTAAGAAVDLRRVPDGATFGTPRTLAAPAAAARRIALPDVWSAPVDRSSRPIPAAPPGPPTNLSRPQISGIAQEGQTLTASPGSWSGTSPISYAYRWRACNATGSACVNIAGAKAQSHTLTATQIGTTIRVVVTASNPTAFGMATSAETPTVVAATLGGASFYVAPNGSDTNPGSLLQPWRTLGKAMTTLVAGQTAYLRAGTYEENKGIACGSDYNRLRWNTSGSPVGPITISGFPGEEKQVIVKTALDLRGDHQRLLNLVVDKNLGASSFDSGACTGTLSVSVYADFDEVRGVEIRNSNMSALYLSGADNAKVIGNYIHSNGVHNNLDHGIYYSSGTNGLIANNVIAGNETQGVSIYPSPSKITVAQNTIVGNGKSGVFVGGNSSTGRFATDTLIVNNVSAFNGEYGIRSYWGGEVGTGNTAVRNVVFGNAAGAFYLAPGGLTESESILQDPLFVSAGTGDYRLALGSPAIGAARPEHSQTHDFDGRVRDAQPDIGAFEH